MHLKASGVGLRLGRTIMVYKLSTSLVVKALGLCNRFEVDSYVHQNHERGAPIMESTL